MEALARRHIEDLERAYGELRGAAERLGLDGLRRPTAAGWSGKEMLAHVAFWEEAAVPVVTFMLRGLAMPAAWEFGSGTFAEREWPPADVHNAREAAWARGHSEAQVLARWAAAQAALVAAIATVSDAEATRHHDYFAGLAAHLAEHAPELTPSS